MAKFKRYEGEFISRADTRWRVEIWQESDFAYNEVKELRFPSESPLIIEWKKGSSKIQPVLPSAATLTLVSETDREFIDLYQVKVGAVRLDVYRENALYWSGTLDTELYEEPYAYKDGYEVTITFSDLAILDRLNFMEELGIFIQMSDLIEQCIQASGINIANIVEHISTTPDGGGALTSTCYFISDNFYDEDDVPMTIREVLDSILQPFALSLIQKNGKIIVYDINSLYTTFTPERVEWTLTDSVLSVDKTYNNVELTFSPYMKNKLIKVEFDPEEVKDGAEYLIKTDYSAAPFDGFKIRISDTENNKVSSVFPERGKINLYSITPVFSASKEAGIAWIAKTGQVIGENNVSYTTRVDQVYAMYYSEITKRPVVMKCNSMPYVCVDSMNENNYLLRLTMSLMMDFRMNPFEDASEFNDKEVSDDAQERTNLVYVLFILRLKDKNGNVLYHYDNMDIVRNSSTPIGKWGKWVPGDNEGIPGAGGTGAQTSWLSFYDADDHLTGTPMSGGFATNKHALGFYWGESLPKYYKFYSDGEVFPLPPVSGYLELTIIGEVAVYQQKGIESFDFTKDIKWCFIDKIGIDVIDQYGRDLDESDVIVTSFVERDAREQLTIDTTVGTLPATHPSARGQVFTSSRNVIKKFVRAGITDTLENLLCGTVYSQYKGRKRLLSGTILLAPDFRLATDENEPGSYLIAGESQNVIADESEVELIELSEENYEGIEYE